MIKAPVLFLFLVVALLGGCASVSRQAVPHFDRNQVKMVFVERRLADNNNVRDRLVNAVRELGFEAEAGPLTLMPEKGVDVVLGYDDRWDWNFGDYMVELKVELRHPRTQELLASALVRRSAMFGKSTDQMVKEAVDALFRAQRKAKA